MIGIIALVVFLSRRSSHNEELDYDNNSVHMQPKYGSTAAVTEGHYAGVSGVNGSQYMVPELSDSNYAVPDLSSEF